MESRCTQNEVPVKIGRFSPSRGRAVLRRLSFPLMCVALGPLRLPRQAPKTQPEERQVQQTANGSDQALRKHLLAMQKADRTIRDRAMVLSPERQATMAPALKSTDEKLTGELKQIVAEKGWPTIDLVGRDASEAASSILLHSRDRDFQKTLLPQLEKLVAEDRIAGSNVALLVDTILRSEGKPQRFGTQFKIHGGKAVIDPVEDPARLDERRAKYQLSSMAEYKYVISQLYRVKVE
jgi:BMFP domain-containing protein YqiC